MSTYSEVARSYITNIGESIDVEKMGVVLQTIVGKQHPSSKLVYPEISGVAQSHNYYPVGKMKSENGVAYLAFGLGSTVVDGKRSLRFSPVYPEQIPQLATLQSALQTTQSVGMGISMERGKPTLENFNLT